MEYKSFIIYLISVNIAGFLIYLLNTYLYTHREGKRVDGLLTLVVLAGGSFGALLALLLFDRKAVKENMMARVYISCLVVIHAVGLLYLRGHHAPKLNLAFWTFFAEHRFLMIYLGLVNVIAFILYAVDKYNSIKDGRRIRIVTLLAVAYIGGSAGGLLAMYLLRHKTKKNYFTVGLPLMILMQVVVLLYGMNFGW